MKKDFLYKTIANQIRNLVQNNGYSDQDGCLPTTSELAIEFNTSPMTIHKALNILVEDGYIHRVPGKGTFVKKVSPVETNKKSGIVGAIVYDTSGHSLWSISLKGMIDSLQDQDYTLLIGNNDGDFERAKRSIVQFAEKNIDGLIFVPIGCPTEKQYEKKNLELLQLIESFKIPYVLFHRYLSTKAADVVAVDDFQDTLKLVYNFFKRKVKHPICLSHYFTTCTNLRERAFMQALLENGHTDPVSAIKRIFPEGQKTDARVSDAIKRILDEDPLIDGIFAVENDVLTETLNIIKAHDYLLERNIHFCCFDYSNTVDHNEVTDIMDVPTYNLGYATGDAILRRIASTSNFHGKLLLPSTLRKR